MKLFVDEICRNFQVNSKIDGGFDFRQHLTRLQLVDCPFQHLTVKVEPDGFDVPVLLTAQQVPGAAQLQVQSRDSKTCAQFAEFANGGKPAAGNLGQRFIRRYQEIGVSTTVGPADSAAQLVELREPVAVGAIHDESVGKRNIETIFNNGGRNQNIEFVMHEFCHHLLELFLIHLTVGDANPRLGSQVLHEAGERVNRFDSVVDNVNLATALEFEIDGILNHNRLELDDHGLNRQAVTGRSFNDGHVAQSAERHVQRPRNRCCRHGHDIDLFLDVFQTLFMSDTKPLLLVDDHQSEIVELDVLRQQAVRTDDDIDLARFDITYDFPLLFGRDEAAQHRDGDRKGRESFFERFVVLVAKDRRGRQHRDLLAVADGFKGGAHGDFRFAITDITADEAIHRQRRF